MSDSSPFGFGKFVPGFDFLQGLAKGAAGSIPQMPQLSNWVAPTISVEELDKRIDELKAVQFWLEQNSRALSATVQALEVQKMTLATLKGMNFSMGDVANAFKLKAADTVMGGVHKAGEGIAQAAHVVGGVASRAADLAKPAEQASEPEDEPAESPQADQASAKGKAKSKGKAAAATSVVDPMQWWGALTQQFQQIAGAAMKDAAHQAAMDTARNLATGMAQDALKTATGMAGKMASQGVKNLQGATRAAAGAAKPRAKPAAKKAAKAPAKKAAPRKAAAKKKAPARKAAAKK